ncbi:uncharacterized protein ACA1_371180 [Acanthamoeba castellanii str. Neff]|uniref:Uncharacterized protein n=1 Tax=Acanthamoeba castellanii (strain ATCC 30010 / Neff) TaxID=1257118 RepID=L8H0J5_ACACF|nr:uncharacterized protein ACA1_371180 [Acanthamoeba castellanii str. Neff]ELR18293.1 hypothetical protein ACA1_371180 [Acanthamoeba castellanii str. Neff]
MAVTHIQLNTWELFTIIMIMWFVISLWGDIFKSIIKHFVLAHNKPQPRVMAASTLVLTTALVAITKIIRFNFMAQATQHNLVP